MRKTLLGLLALSSLSAFAYDETPFQQFDNQYNVGYSLTNVLLSNGASYQTMQQNQFVNLEVERLFNAGVWMDVGASFLVQTNSLGNKATGTGQGLQPLTQDPALAGLNAKVGWAFPVVKNHLLITPYVLAGRNTNLAMSTLTANNTQNITNDFFYTGGVGARLEYRVNNWLDLYADQNATYNWDQSQPIGGIMPQNNMVYTSTLGAKFNVVKNLQLGINSFYNNYQYMATAPATGATNGGFSTVTGLPYSIYQPQYQLGGMVTVGLTY